MHFENFYNYKMRSLTLKLSFCRRCQEEKRDRIGLKLQPQGQSIKGRLQKIILYSDKISFPTNIPD